MMMWKLKLNCEGGSRQIKVFGVIKGLRSSIHLLPSIVVFCREVSCGARLCTDYYFLVALGVHLCRNRPASQPVTEWPRYLPSAVCGGYYYDARSSTRYIWGGVLYKAGIDYLINSIIISAHKSDLSSPWSQTQASLLSIPSLQHPKNK